MNIKSHIKTLIGHNSDHNNKTFTANYPAINKAELLAVKADNMMITVGFDFGTHQTKVCIESKGGVELSYTFMKYEGTDSKSYYTLPSIIGIGNDKHLYYGFMPKGFQGDIVRYFKQGAFRGSSPDNSMTQELAIYYSIWYTAFILFDLEDIFGQNFVIQMGAPTDSSHILIAKQIATRIIASAYKLVEDVFENDKQRFLDADIDSLKNATEIVKYTDSIKEEYVLLVFPEAYACLKPLISQKKIATGMSLMIDIGGGTTDISFFTIENNVPQVYDFFSINKGLNYLTCADERVKNGYDSNVRSVSEIDKSRKTYFTKEVDTICNNIRSKLLNEFKHQTFLDKGRLFDALKNRPLVYCGGGSTFSSLRESHGGYQDKKQISDKEWDTKSIPQIEEIISKELCPILSTAYGLAISTEHDNIKMKPFRDIFEGIRGLEEEKNIGNRKWASFGDAYGGFNYSDDWDAWK